MLADAAKRLTVETLRAWRSQRLTQFGLVALLHGNLDEEQAIDIVESVRARMPVEAVAPFRVEIAKVAANYRVPLAIDHADAAVALYVQDEQPGINARAQSALAAQLMKQAFFTELRTEQQLGYAVFAQATPFRDQGGLSFIVQSPVASPAALEQAILTFLDTRPEAVRQLSDEAFAQHKAGLISDPDRAGQEPQPAQPTPMARPRSRLPRLRCQPATRRRGRQLKQGGDGGLHGSPAAKGAKSQAHHLQHGQVQGAAHSRGIDRESDLAQASAVLRYQQRRFRLYFRAALPGKRAAGEACPPNSRRNGGRESSSARP